MQHIPQVPRPAGNRLVEDEVRRKRKSSFVFEESPSDFFGGGFFVSLKNLQNLQQEYFIDL